MKNLHCADAGFDCKGVITANSEDEVLQLAAVHAKEVHGVSVSPEMAAQLRTLIKDDANEIDAFPLVHSSSMLFLYANKRKYRAGIFLLFFNHQINLPKLMENSQSFLKKLGFLADTALQEELFEHGELISMKKGDVVVKDGQYVRFLPIVIKGAIRVYQQKEDREILLYYVRAEETCTMSLAAAYFNNKSTSHGVVMEETEVLVFPADFIMQWQLKYPSWNNYVMQMFRQRYDELIGSFERIAFDHINVRIMEYLKKKGRTDATSTINISHQNLAYELGTTRVVVSRILKQFERENKIKLLRGSIELIEH